eukprot:6474388-Amphidinium_carterae.1
MSSVGVRVSAPLIVTHTFSVVPDQVRDIEEVGSKECSLSLISGMAPRKGETLAEKSARLLKASQWAQCKHKASEVQRLLKDEPDV